MAAASHCLRAATREKKLGHADTTLEKVIGFMSGVTAVWQVIALLFVVGWIFQFVGHFVEELIRGYIETDYDYPKTISAVADDIDAAARELVDDGLVDGPHEVGDEVRPDTGDG